MVWYISLLLNAANGQIYQKIYPKYFHRYDLQGPCQHENTTCIYLKQHEDGECYSGIVALMAVLYDKFNS